MSLNEEESLDWFKRLAETRLYRLAVYNLIRTKQVKADKYTGEIKIHPFKVILEGLRILTIANKKKLTLWKKFTSKKRTQDDTD